MPTQRQPNQRDVAEAILNDNQPDLSHPKSRVRPLSQLGRSPKRRMVLKGTGQGQKRHCTHTSAQVTVQPIKLSQLNTLYMHVSHFSTSSKRSKDFMISFFHFISDYYRLLVIITDYYYYSRDYPTISCSSKR